MEAQKWTFSVCSAHIFVLLHLWGPSIHSSAHSNTQMFSQLNHIDCTITHQQISEEPKLNVGDSRLRRASFARLWLVPGTYKDGQRWSMVGAQESCLLEPAHQV